MILYSIILFAIAKTLNIYPTFQEKNHWNLQQLLGEIENPIYELDDSSFAFQIIEPIYPSQTPRNHIKQCSQIVTVKPLVSKGSNWLNNYLFLDTNSQNTTLFYSQNAQDDFHTPYFNRYLEVVKNSKSIKCFDADYIDQTHFLIDCTDTEKSPYVDILYIKNTDGEELQFQQLSSRTNQINSRILRIHSKFGLRGSPDNSLIQVFEVTANNVIYGPDNINSQILKKWFNLASTYTFQLVDFKIDNEGFLFILDKKYLFKCQIQENGAILPTKLIRYFEKQTAISFDINYQLNSDGQIEEMIGILFNTQFVVQMNTDYKTIIFTSIITNQIPNSIKLTNNFVMILTKKQVLLYSIEREIQLYSKDIQQGSYYLLNPYVPYYVQISNIRSQVGYLSEGILRLISTSNPVNQQVVTIQAKSLDQQIQKSYQFMYSMVQEQDQSLYEMNEWVIFQEPIVGQSNNIQIKQFMSGPDIQYNVVPDYTGINLEFQSNIVLQTQFPSAQSIVYQDMLQIDSELMYQIFQLNNFELQLYQCLPNQKGYLDHCFYIISIHTYLIKMNKNKFQWWTNSDYIYLVYTNDNTNIEIIKLKQNNPEEEVMLTIISEQLITQLVYSNDVLYSLCENEKVINLYDVTDNFNILDQITENNVQLLGYQEEWNPKQIWTSNINSIKNIVIIRNIENIQIARYHNEFVLIKRIQINKDEQINVAISKESFIIYRNNDVLNQIEEYNIQDLSEIYLSKIIPTYHHTLVSFVGSSDDLFFMSSIYQNYQYILAYQFNSLSHSSLLREINASTPILSSVIGGQRTYLYLNHGNQHNYYLIMKQIEVNVAIVDDSKRYYFQVNKYIQISNQVTKFNHMEYIKIVNTMLDLNIVSNIHPITFNKTNQIEQFNLGTTWYTGQATHFKLRCDQCEKGIHLLNPINLINNNSFIDRNIKYITNFNDQLQVFLESNTLYLVNLDNQIIQTVQFDQYANCSQVQTHPSQQYILALCQSTFYLVQYKLQVLSILGDSLPIQSMSSMKFIDESWILIYSLNKLYIYQLSIYQDSWKLEQFKQLDQIVIDYDVTQNNTHYAVVQTIDDLGNLTINYIEIFISEIQINFNVTTSLANLITENQQYQRNSTKFLRIQIESANYLRQQLIDLSFWIISSDVAHYRYYLQFDQVGRINNSQINGIINQYGDWIATGQMIYKNYSLIITYTNGKQLLHAYYHTQDISKIQATTMIGGMKVVKQDQSTLCLFYKFNQLYLYAKANNNILSTYQVYDAPEIVLTLGQNLDHEQILNISAINDYNQKFQTFQLDQEVNNQNSSNYIWIIILISVFLGFALLLTLYVWRRRVSLRKQMDNPNNQTGDYSLMKL